MKGRLVKVVIFQPKTPVSTTMLSLPFVKIRNERESGVSHGYIAFLKVKIIKRRQDGRQ
jgi:hypothetical protein